MTFSFFRGAKCLNEVIRMEDVRETHSTLPAPTTQGTGTHPWGHISSPVAGDLPPPGAFMDPLGEAPLDHLLQGRK